MKRLLQLLTWVFVAAASWLVWWARTEGHKMADVPPHILVLFWVTVFTLPAAAVQVYIQDDAKSRRNWLLMMAIFGVLLVAALLMKPVRW